MYDVKDGNYRFIYRDFLAKTCRNLWTIEKIVKAADMYCQATLDDRVSGCSVSTTAQ
jgi:hypothetical protein